MTQFWMIVAAMILIAVTLIVLPLFRQNKKHGLSRKQQNVMIARQRLEELIKDLIQGDMTREQYTQARAELEQTLYDDLDGLEKTDAVVAPRGRWLAPVIAILLPLTACWIYLDIGTPQAVTMLASQNIPNESSVSPHAPSLPSIEEMAERLRDRLEKQPDDITSWMLLARTYKVMNRYQDTALVMEEIHNRVGDEPTVLVQYADALAMSNGGKLQGKPIELINRALDKQPNHPTGLWLAGMAAAELGNSTQALAYWQKLEPLLKADPESLQRLKQLIRQAEQRLGIDRPEQPATTIAAQDSEAVPDKNVRVKITLAAALRDQINPNDRLFIYAKALSGPPMPLAVVRTTAADLPFQVILNDSQAMMPAMKLSNFTEVRIGARISKTGNAIAQSGDFQGEVEPVQVGNPEVINIIIAERIP